MAMLRLTDILTLPIATETVFLAWVKLWSCCEAGNRIKTFNKTKHRVEVPPDELK